MNIDIHAHAFHPKIANKVVAQLHDHYGIPPVGDGTIEDLLARSKKADIDKVVIHTAATDPAQVIPANNWALELMEKHDEVISFGSMHPDYANIEQELDRIYARGIRGLKFHPDFQSFRMDDPKFYDLVEKLENRFTLMFHVGDVLPPEQNPSCPIKLAALKEAFPKTTMIAAHLGGYRHWEWVIDSICGKEIYIDTSSALPFIPQEHLDAIMKSHPREFVLFGSDYPLFDTSEEIYLVQEKLKFKDREVDEIMQNAQVFLT
ncbi:MAG: amidohydrolase family protein [Desulfovibrio sp.]